MKIMRVYIKCAGDNDYRFDFGFSDDLEKIEVTENTLRVLLKDGQDSTFEKPAWDWKIVSEQ